MSDHTVLEQIRQSGIVVIIRGVNEEHISETVQAIDDGGIDVIEITANTPGAISIIEHISKKHNITIGAGTVLDPETVRAAQLAGAEFIVTPTLNKEVIDACNRYNTPVATGVMTPSEAVTAVEAGAEFCKLFPASTAEPQHLEAVTRPLSHISFIPTGGISLDNVSAYFDAGAKAVGVGSSIVDQKAINNEDFQQIKQNAKLFQEAVDRHFE